MKPALLVIDVQKAFFQNSPATKVSLDNAVDFINAAIPLFRKKGLPVIAVQHISREGSPKPGEEGFDLPEALNILPIDLHIHKTRGNSFHKTPLEEALRKDGIDTLIVTGYCAEYCVLSTCRGAEDLDLAPIILRGAIASDVAENVGFVERIGALISFGALSKILE
jgi:nicotinamidase-related amidase